MTSAEAAQVVTPPPEVDLHGLYAFHSGYVAGLAFKLLGRAGDTDDLVQDVFLAAMTNLKALRDPQAVRGWLATVTVRLAGRKLRRRKIAAFFAFDDGRGHDVTAPGASPEDRALLGQVYEHLHELGVAERLAWTLRHVEGESLDRVAQLCGCSLATAKRRVAAAHYHLEEALGDEAD
jgi:RNA polymerase sigma-70 factor, ECF subfamily